MEKEIKKLKSEIKLYSIMEIFMFVVPLVMAITGFVMNGSPLVFILLIVTTKFALGFGESKMKAKEKLNELLKEIKTEGI